MGIDYDFQIRHQNNDERKILSELVLKLIHKHELKNFQIEESYWPLTNKIILNGITLISGNNLKFEDVEEAWKKSQKSN